MAKDDIYQLMTQVAIFRAWVFDLLVYPFVEQFTG